MSKYVEIVKEFIKEHSTLGYVGTAKKYFSQDTVWETNNFRTLYGFDQLLPRLIMLDKTFERPYGDLTIEYIGALGENRVVIMWIEDMHNQDTGYIPYRGRNDYFGHIADIITFDENDKICHQSLIFDTTQYDLPKTAPLAGTRWKSLTD